MPERLRLPVLVLAMIAIQAITLAAFGQPPICTCGTVRLWSGEILSPENSQQITDWYTPSHVIHGLLFYGILRWLFPKLPLIGVVAAALAVEIGWELLENSPLIIDRYRAQALAQGYSGDSVLNSVCDSLAMLSGLTLARFLPVRLTVGLAVAAEIFTAVMVRDNLTLNVIQLLVPSPTISAWQAQGGLASAPIATAAPAP
ncbi:DUF2585 family protein [Oryzibacter oryziterrae]|uniref:DUF2585 family protein n=1 Tax=Oryzibacter oryziterrae TaxID=2766474 RepID=UPI001F0030A6|nr:DUF2585 family protein [Oryzibacter oryziterrae]